MNEVKINGFTLEVTGELFRIESRNWLNHQVVVIALPDGSDLMPRNALDLLVKQKFLGNEILGVESFAKGTVRVGDKIGIATKSKTPPIAHNSYLMSLFLEYITLKKDKKNKWYHKLLRKFKRVTDTKNLY